MKNAILLHGMPDKEEYFDTETPSQSNLHWFPWLQKQLILHEILAQTPELPEPYTPNYSKQRVVFEQFYIDGETILVGFSCGGGFLMRWLSENKVKSDKVILVAPWIDPDKTLQSDFFKFTFDNQLISRTNELIIFYSLDDYPDIIKSVETIKSVYPTAKIIEFKNKGHFTQDSLGSLEFPELLKEIIG